MTVKRAHRPQWCGGVTVCGVAALITVWGHIPHPHKVHSLVLVSGPSSFINITASLLSKLSNKSQAAALFGELRNWGRIIFHTFTSGRFQGLGTHTHTDRKSGRSATFFYMNFHSLLLWRQHQVTKEAPNARGSEIKEFTLLGLQLQKPALLSPTWAAAFPSPSSGGGGRTLWHQRRRFVPPPAIEHTVNKKWGTAGCLWVHRVLEICSVF